MKIDGGCHCGNIAYRAEVDPGMVGICHCTDCQTLTGSAFRATPCPRRLFRAGQGRPEDLYQDRRERRKTRPRLLRQLWHTDLRRCDQQSSYLFAASRHYQAAFRVAS